MTILDKITAYKRAEISQREYLVPVESLKKQALFNRETYSLKVSILTKSGVIAEFKRKSPSKRIINDKASVKEVASGYEKVGASGISVLTDSHFFGGSNEDLFQARQAVDIPILRKDFILSTYQIYEAKAIGADVILLIAAILTKEEIKEFTNLAHQLGLEVLLEIHSEKELEKYHPSIQLIGINNRNLKTFKVDFEHSISLSEKLPKDSIKIAESGINYSKNINRLKKHGFKGFLIGENFMKTENPALACANIINEIAL